MSLSLSVSVCLSVSVFVSWSESDHMCMVACMHDSKYARTSARVGAGNVPVHVCMPRGGDACCYARTQAYI